MDKDTYTEAEDFAMDVRLIFKNCLAFNDHESDLVFMAQSLRKLFEDAFAEIKRREKREQFFPNRFNHQDILMI